MFVFSITLVYYVVKCSFQSMYVDIMLLYSHYLRMLTTLHYYGTINGIHTKSGVLIHSFLEGVLGLKIENVRTLVYQEETLGLRFSTDIGIFDAGKDSLFSKGVVNLDTGSIVELVLIDNSFMSEEDLEDVEIVDVSDNLDTLAELIESLILIERYHHLFHPSVMGYYVTHQEVAAATETDQAISEFEGLEPQLGVSIEYSLSDILPFTKGSDTGSSLRRFVTVLFDRLSTQEDLQRTILAHLETQGSIQSTILTRLEAQETSQGKLVSTLEHQNKLITEQTQLIKEQSEAQRQAKASADQHDKELMHTLRTFTESGRQESDTTQPKRWWLFGR